MIDNKRKISFKDILKFNKLNLKKIEKGSVVALIGDFEAVSISNLINLIDHKCIIMPLTDKNKDQHEYFFNTGFVEYVILNNKLIKRNITKKNRLIEKLKKKNRPGLILFSSGTTSEPKAILHDFSYFLKRFETPKKNYRTLNFLLFDHIGGLNTFFHTIFNKGTIISIKERDTKSVLNVCKKFNIEVLPTTPTFLKMLTMVNKNSLKKISSLKVITYGTEVMSEILLGNLCKLLPNVDFRQTYGLSEIGIMRIKSKQRNSLLISIGGEGIKTKIVNNLLFVKSKYQMIGYLNAPNPFDTKGWFNTRDIIKKEDSYIKIIGREDNIINVGGLKFISFEVENIANKFKDIIFTKAIKKNNPITGHHVELIYKTKNEKKLNKVDFKKYLAKNLQKHMVPKRLIEDNNLINHRFKIR